MAAKTSCILAFRKFKQRAYPIVEKSVVAPSASLAHFASIEQEKSRCLWLPSLALLHLFSTSTLETHLTRSLNGT